MKKNKENIFGVKIGDIFCYKLEFVRFFQVVDLRGTKQVVVKEIEDEEIEDVSAYETRVMPIKDKFTEKSTLLKKMYPKDDLNKGDIKTVSLNDDNIPQLTGLNCQYAICELWNGKDMISSCWSAIMR